MSDKSKIEWTDATWNPVTGCSKVSAGCKHCYAEREWPRMTKLVPAYSGRAFSDVRCHPERLEQPLHWKKPRKVFVNSMSDLFHESVPDEFIDQVFAVMALAPQHTFQILTKRPERMLSFAISYKSRSTTDGVGISVPGCVMDRLITEGRFHMPELAWPLPNVWLGVSVEDQATADERIPLLLQAPAAVRWISAEPLLGRVDLRETFGMWWNQSMNCFEGISSTPFNRRGREGISRTGIDWVVVGGESGRFARPMHPEWVRSLRDQCAAAGVPFLFKQWGEFRTEYDRDKEDQDLRRCHFVKHKFQPGQWLNLAGGHGFHGERVNWMHRVGKKRAGRLLDGIQHDGYPEDRP